MRTILALGFLLLPCLVGACTFYRMMSSKLTPEQWQKESEEFRAQVAIRERELRPIHEQLYGASKEHVVLTLGQPDPKFIFKRAGSHLLKKGSTYEFATVEEQKTGNYNETFYTERWSYEKEFKADIGDPPRRVRWGSLYYVYFLNDKVVLVR